MRTTPALRTTPAALGALVTALLTAGALSLGGASPASATASPTHNHDVVWGTIVAPVDLKIRDAPSTSASIVAKLPADSQDRVECQTRGTNVWGNAYWYWLGGVQGWASAAYVDTGGQHVPSCATSDPCKEYKPCWDTCQGGYNRYH
ncbi:SH3 domain-containing protein [Streptomyces sp. BA2]|uniref:SH3 domain-containing protein n=1 Tax=Streptomyces sp. BA2 TaxID=436595 RepID=UPI001321F1C5|nr:SH3 domain-containing protein [Streptomyces sp. BA2]MWA12428.1 SH3 domain-containing protein [Streptomyces sp. BA2]